MHAVNLVSTKLLFKFKETGKSPGPVIRRPINSNPGLNPNPGFFFLLVKSIL